MFNRPQFKPRFHVEVVEPSTVYLMSGREHVVLTSHLCVLLAPLLNGQHTIDQIVEKLSGNVSLLAIYYVLANLENQGYLTEVAELPNELSAFWSLQKIDPEVAANLMTVHPKISIVTTNYNYGHFLEETILSVISQNYPNLEYIIIDGGSTDRSLEVIQKYESYLSYWISEPDFGQANGINKGLRKCTGEIVGFLNSDDLYKPDTFETVASVFQDIRNSFIFG